MIAVVFKSTHILRFTQTVKTPGPCFKMGHCKPLAPNVYGSVLTDHHGVNAPGGGQ